MESIKTEPLDTRGRDAERSQAEILQAAREEFASHGLAGARVDRIAERAGLNKRLIYYYFNSKDDLFLAVLESVYADIRAAEQRLHLLDMEPAQAVRRLTEFTWQYYLEHPEFITLLNSANLHQARHLQRSSRVREMNSPVIQTLGDVLERGRKTGVFRGGVPTPSSSTSRSPGWPTSTSPTTTRCRPSSDATCDPQGARGAALAHVRRDPRVCLRD